jgi:hypothetical protein
MRTRWLVPALLLLAAAPANARPVARFLVDGVIGVNIPIANGNYVDSYYPSPTFGLHFGGEIWVARHFAVAPELALDGGPLLDRVTNPTTGRARFQLGMRFLFGFGRGHAVFLRWLAGAELLAYGPGGPGGQGTVNAGFATEPGVGMQFRVSRHAVVGFVNGFPIGVHSYGRPSEVNADFDISFFVGYRQ